MSRILLVEDEAVTREGIEEYLTFRGYEVSIAPRLMLTALRDENIMKQDWN